MDFFKIKESISKDGCITIYPDFIVGKTKDIMVRGKSFYAIWDEEEGMWSKDQYDVVRLVDEALLKRYSELKGNYLESKIKVKTLSDFSTGSWDAFCKYLNRSPDNSKQLDLKVTFQNDIVKRTDYVSKRLPYSKGPGDISSYDKLMSVLYSPEERQKIEWAIGAIITGDGKKIQKFLVFYGPAGAGKSTVLNIVQDLFQGYYTTFDARELTTIGSSFATDSFANDPLVAIQHDGDLSGIKDNSKLNSIVSHEEIIINEKFKARYTTKANCFLFMGTNKPVKITDGKSGIIRRLIDVKPTGNKLEHDIYDSLMNDIEFELGAIADHCEKVYLSLGKNYYDTYKPLEMMFKTDPFFNFVEEQYFLFKEEDGVSLKQAYAIYKEYCKETGAEYVLQMYKFREELKNYFRNFEDLHYDGDIRIRSYYSGFLYEKFKIEEPIAKSMDKDIPEWLHLGTNSSNFDILCNDCYAQYGTNDGKPLKRWNEVSSKLKDIDTHKLHYVRVPIEHIVIDFDLKGTDGSKDMKRNLEAAKAFPKTYAELSKSGGGLHLHYIYTGGDPADLSNLISEGIEIKVFTGLSSLRRKLSLCNNESISEISSGLPRKEKKKVINFTGVANEKTIRSNILNNLQKKVHPYTKPSVDMIKKILDDAYESGVNYDVSDLYTDILMFASLSTHQKEACLKQVREMKFCSKDISRNENYESDKKIIFYDVEVFPNLFVLVYKILDNDALTAVINPKRSVLEDIFKHKLVGFNNRRYDNHILYAWYMGYNNEQLYTLSQRIINNSQGFFGEAYNLSYADIYDFASKKQSLKKWEIELGIHHKELGLPWDKPVPKELWNEVAEYCKNDVIATEAVWKDPGIQEDFVARQVLADISGLTVNDTTRQHTTKIIFGDDDKPELVYTDLSKMFPGYEFKFGKSSYRGEDPGEGGYVYAEPGIHTNVALLDIASMHPSSIEALNLFGEYTSRFSDIKNARIFIKHKDFESASKLLNGAFKPYLQSESQAKALAQSLKIIINSVYGYTTANFNNPFKDPRNVDNIVAKRGALFMIDLKHEVQDRGFTVAHIKTDSIKIADATPEIIQFVMEYGKKYGYSFEHEATYSRMCLVNDAVYIAKEKGGDWTATGTQFKVPYVFKTLFSKEPLTFDDFCETKSVTTELYLDFNEKLPEGEHKYIFVGKVGQFTPVKPGLNGGLLCRKAGEKYHAATGSTGYRWVESETIRNKANNFDMVDENYYISQAVKARNEISKYGDFEWFASNDDNTVPF